MYFAHLVPIPYFSVLALNVSLYFFIDLVFNQHHIIKQKALRNLPLIYNHLEMFLTTNTNKLMWVLIGQAGPAYMRLGFVSMQ